MELQTWILYTGLVTLVIVLPGPAAVLCVNHGVSHGTRRALATVLGGSLSALVLITISALGLAQVMVAAPAAFEIARAAGAACLVLMGLRTWRMVTRRGSSSTRACAAPLRDQRSLVALFRDGFLLGISNPKDLLFFGALLPQFLSPATPRAPQLVCMFFTWALIDGVAMSAYAALGQRLVPWLANRQRMHCFQRISGAVLMGSGLALAIAQPALGA
jgi:threonine/homoserine/homoserine lactone efflux protein